MFRFASFAASIVAVTILPFQVVAQTPAATPAATPATPAPAASAGTFSMEAEVFAYRALQSDAESIACNVGGYLTSTVAKPTDPTGYCTPAPDGTGKKLIIVSSTSTVLSNFQVWRANMAIAQELLDLANAQACPVPASV